MINTRRCKIQTIATPWDSQWAKRSHEDEPHPDDERTPFQHDKDRILHSTAFRRLQYKTQVYVIHEGDLYRTRLTHTLEVAQIARGLAQTLKANTDLAEAIALAHDLGHTPFGHAGGDKLKELLGKCGRPFDHNVQSYRIVSNLEERYVSFGGINLTRATLEGILRHCTYFDEQEHILSSIPEEIREEVSPHWNSPQPSAEAQIVNIADIIAYAAHDIEDALAMGLIDWESFSRRVEEKNIELLKEVIFRELNRQENIYRKHNVDAPDAKALKMKNRIMPRLIIDKLIRETVRQTEANITRLGNENGELWAKLREHQLPIVALPTEIEKQVKTLVGDVLFNSIYREPRVMVMLEKAKRIVDVLFHTFMGEPEVLPKLTQARLADYFAMAERKRKSKIGRQKLATVVGDYISGMTDKYAMDMYQLLTQAYEKAL